MGRAFFSMMPSPFGWRSGYDPTRPTPRVASFGYRERALLKNVPSMTTDLMARSVHPLDISGPTHLCPRLHTPWAGKDIEMDDWTARKDFGRIPKYLKPPGSSWGLSQSSSHSTCSALSHASHGSSVMSESTMRNTEHPLRWSMIRRRQSSAAPHQEYSSGAISSGSRSETPSPTWKRSCTTFGLPHEMLETPRHVPALSHGRGVPPWPPPSPWRGGGVRPFPQAKCVGLP